VPAGLWTSYSEVGAAVTGTRRAARAVGRAAARDPHFPNAWRVIHADGSIPEGWGGGGAERARCRRLLEEEGVRFTNGRADPEQKLLADEIELLLGGASHCA
jgi:alkylated DNA nucleotide flippase Atl1